jgi:hypothetical protein
MASWERWRRPIMGHTPIFVLHLHHSLLAPTDSIFIRQETCEERDVRVCVSIMIKEDTVMGMVLIQKGSAIQEIWETSRCAKKRSLATMI